MKLNQTYCVEGKIGDRWTATSLDKLEAGDTFRIKDSKGNVIPHNGYDELIFVSQTIIVAYPKVPTRTLWQRVKSFFNPSVIIL